MQSHFLCAFWWWIEIYNEYESHVDIPQFAFEIPLIDCNSDKLPGKYTTISLLKLKQNKYICLECNNVTECWAPLETSFYKLWFSNDIWGIPVLLCFLPVFYGMGMRTGMPQISFDASPVLWERLIGCRWDIPYM